MKTVEELVDQLYECAFNLGVTQETEMSPYRFMEKRNKAKILKCEVKVALLDKIYKNKRPKIFISGALNSDSVGFMENMRAMLLYAGEVRKHARVYVPINDFILSLLTGVLTREEYWKIDLEELEDCDALALVPDTIISPGVAGEMVRAMDLNLPILHNWDEVKEFVDGENRRD